MQTEADSLGPWMEPVNLCGVTPLRNYYCSNQYNRAGHQYAQGLTLQQTEIYTILTVGDGLVAQVPAILISTAAGMLVTRSTAEASFGAELTGQFLSYPRVILLTAGMLFLLGLVPGLPTLPFFILSAFCAWLSMTLIKKQRVEREEQEELAAATRLAAVEPEDMYSLLKVELLEIEIGYNLISNRGGGGRQPARTDYRRPSEGGRRARDNYPAHPHPG